MWANPHLFKTDANGKATCIAGCPPDEFSATGQLWGNPIYDWEAMDKDGYKWWIERLRESFKIYDIVRIDTSVDLSLTGKFLLVLKQRTW